MGAAFNKKEHEVAFELLSLKNFVKGKCETFTNWKRKRRYQEINFIKNIRKQKFYFGPLLLAAL